VLAGFLTTCCVESTMRTAYEKVRSPTRTGRRTLSMPWGSCLPLNVESRGLPPPPPQLPRQRKVCLSVGLQRDHADRRVRDRLSKGKPMRAASLLTPPPVACRQVRDDLQGGAGGHGRLVWHVLHADDGGRLRKDAVRRVCRAGAASVSRAKAKDARQPGPQRGRRRDTSGHAHSHTLLAIRMFGTPVVALGTCTCTCTCMCS